MKKHKFFCPQCKTALVSSIRVFECPECGFEPEIEDYKEAFEQLMEQHQAQVEESNKTIWTFSDSLQDSRRMCKILTVTTVITSILLILALLK